MKKLSITLITILAVAACDKAAYLQKDGFPSEADMAEKGNGRDITGPITYLAETDFDAWVAIPGILDRFAACDVPEETIERMTTEAIVESVLRFPLNYLVPVYNDPYDAVSMVYDNSSLHRALFKREDAVPVLVRKFALTCDDLSGRHPEGENIITLPYMDEIFFEYLLASEYFPSDFLKEEDFEILRRAVENKNHWRMEHPDTYSVHSLIPLWEINENRALGIADCGTLSTKSNNAISTVALKTPYSQTIIGEMRSEMTASEVQDQLNNYTALYPDAIVRGASTALYNGNSYTWYQSSLLNNVWIPNYYGGNLQIARYWTDDEYVECSADSAEKAYYVNGGQNMEPTSSIVIPSGKFLTKWGNGPLMEHDYDYGPYDHTNIKYFKKRTSPAFSLTVTGPTPVYKEDSNLYYFNCKYPDMTYEVEVAFMDNLSISPGTYDLTMTGGNMFKLVCHEYGLYKVSVYASLGGEVKAYGYLNVISIGT